MFWKTVGRWALVAIALPLAATALRKIGRRMESRSGSSRISRTLGNTASGLDTLTGRKTRAVVR
jgi:hypothetical protein